MNEMYWLTRISDLNTVFSMLLLIAGLILVLSLVFAPIIISEMSDMDEKDRSDLIKFIERWLAKIGIIIAVCTIGYIFTPSHKDILLIYGLGSINDYVENNDKAKQLPDKAVDALTKYLEMASKEEN